MSDLRLVQVASASIGIGSIPFDLYAQDKNGRMVLFCKTGFPITRKHKEILLSRKGIFFVSKDQLDTFNDYTLDRIDKIVANEEVPLKEKAEVVRGIGKRIVGKLMEDPRSGKAVEHSNRFVNTCIDLILMSPKVTDNLLAFSAADPYTLTHSINVSTFSLLIGKKIFGSGRKDLWLLGMGGLLHDVGMTRVPKQIINKPGKLNSAEMAQIHKHPEQAIELLSNHKLDDSVTLACLQHHERLDGSGYPNKLRGNKIHTFARIVAIADAYDALTTDRPYRKKMSHLEALSQMAKESNKYDGRFLKVLMDVVLNNDEIVEGFIRRYKIDTGATAKTP